jgi:O-antigen/teichoic acid export membrane protein
MEKNNFGMRNKRGLGPKYHSILAYLTFIGLIFAYQLNKEYQDPKTTWHIKNMFGLLLGLFAAVWLQDYPIGFYVYWTVVCLWIYCLVMAILDQKRGIPFLSSAFQKWFKFLDQK